MIEKVEGFDAQLDAAGFRETYDTGERQIGVPEPRTENCSASRVAALPERRVCKGRHISPLKLGVIRHPHRRGEIWVHAWNDQRPLVGLACQSVVIGHTRRQRGAGA